jgi:hypothetical protein
MLAGLRPAIIDRWAEINFSFSHSVRVFYEFHDSDHELTILYKTSSNCSMSSHDEKLLLRVLLVEDEQKIADFVCAGLQTRGFLVEHCRTGHQGLEAAKRHDHDFIVLDVMLPGRDGLSVLKEIRSLGINTPVILLTARNELGDRLEGLELGADDYMAKPFFVEELVARLNVIRRRILGGAHDVLQYGKFRLDLVSRKLSYEGREAELTAREFTLLEYLMRAPGQLFTRAQLLEHVWGYDFDPTTNVVDVCIKRIRNKLAHLEDGVDLSAHIDAVRGVGYRFQP